MPKDAKGTHTHCYVLRDEQIEAISKEAKAEERSDSFIMRRVLDAYFKKKNK